MFADFVAWTKAGTGEVNKLLRKLSGEREVEEEHRGPRARTQV